jgi:hypothetical protein
VGAKQHEYWREMMTILKKLMIATALFAGGSSLAMAQNGLPTGGVVI